MGVLISFFGLCLAASDVNSESVIDKERDIFGDFLCVGSALGQTAVLINRAKIINHVPTMAYTFSTTLVVAFTSSIISVICLGVSFGAEDHGLFGWVSPYWIGKMFIFSFVVGVMCVAGYNYAMKFISPLVFSSVLLVDPAVTGFLSWCLGIEGIPKLYSILGGLVVISGVYFIILGEHQRKDDVKNQFNSQSLSTSIDDIDSSNHIEMGDITTNNPIHKEKEIAIY